MFICLCALCFVLCALCFVLCALCFVLCCCCCCRWWWWWWFFQTSPNFPSLQFLELNHPGGNRRADNCRGISEICGLVDFGDIKLLLVYNTIHILVYMYIFIYSYIHYYYHLSSLICSTSFERRAFGLWKMQKLVPTGIFYTCIDSTQRRG